MAGITFDPAKKLPIYFRVARDGSKTLTFVDTSGDDYDISGFTFALTVYDRVGGNAILSLTEGSGLSKPDNYSLTITVTDTQTALRPNKYFYILNRTDDSSLVKTWLNGDCFIHEGEFDGVNETTTLTIDESGTAVTVTINESGSSSSGTTIPYAVVTGVNSKSGTTSPATSSYTDGQMFLILNSTSNLSSGVTLNLGGGAKSVVKMGNNTLSASADMLAGAFYLVTYRTSIDKFVIVGDVLTAGDGLSRAGGTISIDRDGVFTNTASALVDGTNIDLDSPKQTLSTSEAAITFTISYGGDKITIEVILGATSSTFTFPANSLCVSEGTASGDNTCALSGTSGDRYRITIEKFGSNYFVECKNYGQ